MSNNTHRDKPLFTPGPLTTSASVKQAMLRDLGSRDGEFIHIVRSIRQRLLALAGVSPADGAYGQRIEKIAARYGIKTIALRYRENELPNPTDVDGTLSSNPAVSHVAVIHCETTSGIMNPIEEIGRIVNRHHRTYFVDSMSAFGGVDFDFPSCHIDALVSSANKCIEGVPGFGFAICRRELLERSEGLARTLSLDLVEQWRGLEGEGQFRFTPPTHAMLAFHQALAELESEGGVAGRGVAGRAARRSESHLKWNLATREFPHENSRARPIR